jgi:hypothetical protein
MAVGGAVAQPNGVSFDRDAALALQVHAVEDLRRHLTELQRAGELEKAVGERRFAVIDMRDDREIPNEPLIHAR